MSALSLQIPIYNATLLILGLYSFPRGIIYLNYLNVLLPRF